MKLKYLMLSAIFAASSAVQAAIVEHKLPAPMPEFKTPEQLAKWRQEKTVIAAATDSASVIRDSQIFYTGKPFLQETGSYAFKFRQYDAELNRWTTSDPSGFPDGANNQVYGKDPLSGFDSDGRAWQMEDFIREYYYPSGSVTLSSIGYLAGVKSLAASGPAGGVYRFENQVAANAAAIAKPFNGKFNDKFSNSYDFGSVRYEIGGASLDGFFLGTMTSTPFLSIPNAGTYEYSGTATIYFSDLFTDPTSLIQKLYGSSTSPDANPFLVAIANGGGTAYMITETWTVPFSGSGIYE